LRAGRINLRGRKALSTCRSARRSPRRRVNQSTMPKGVEHLCAQTCDAIGSR